MANKMIIDASHPEETRVVVLRGSRVEEFDFESASKRPLRGNIYLAKVTRVEPSLQAAFVDYGGNRHGFLAFSEIHPDYYQIPVADRQALLDEEAQSQREDDEETAGERRSRRHRRPRRPEVEARVETGEAVSEPATGDEPDSGEPAPEQPSAEPGDDPWEDQEAHGAAPPPATTSSEAGASSIIVTSDGEAAEGAEAESQPQGSASSPPDDAASSGVFVEAQPPGSNLDEDAAAATRNDNVGPEASSHEDDDHDVTTLEGGSEERLASSRTERAEDEGEPVEQIGGDALEEVPRRPPRLRRQYKIQEVIKRRQVLLVQVVKEERGNKGAALTTYLSLAGRYSVLMPNTARGGGISRKITNAQDRSRLKGIAEELDVPEGMGVILRTAGASRTKAEVKRDFEYLLRMWETVRETTLASSAPTLVYEEGSLIKRAIRDLYSKEVEEIVVAGETGYREARQFMRLLMPSHVNNVQLYRDTQPVFAKSGVESQLDSMFSNQVTLKSGGYIVINQTEALVAIDVNSGRSTREHNIEDTALRTNLEAADEIARQLRLRDLAGLIVVDFIDMEESRNNRAVERRIKDALKNDRARIQVGRISHFGLLEMSRQRIRTGVLEGSTVVCPHCQGAGVVRSTASIALHVLRVLEDALIKSSAHDLTVRTRTPVALYILNQKRANLRDLERRFGVAIAVEADDALTGANYHAIERGEAAVGVRSEVEAPKVLADDFAAIVEEPPPIEEEDSEDIPEAAGQGIEEMSRAGERTANPSLDEGDASRRRRRRRRRRGGERPFGESPPQDAPQPTDDGLAAVAEIGGDLEAPKGDVSGRRGPRSDEDRDYRSRRSRGQRNRFAPRSGDAAGREAAPPGFDSPPSLALEEEFAASEADYSQAPSPRDAVPAGEGTAELRQTSADEARAPAASAAVAQEPIDEAPAPVTGAAPVAPTSSPGADNPAAEPAPAAADDEPRRPRRSGWWQRARASVIGE